MLRRALFLLFALVFVSSARAQDTILPIILNASVNGAQTQVTMNGSGFGSVTPTVYLGKTALTVTQSNNTSLTAVLPSNLAPGAYLLSVQNGRSRLIGVFEAAVGQVGPAGPIGPQGLAGIPGPAGPQGATGHVGPTGAIGAAGPAGPAGPMGSIGPAGPAGATGSIGPAGSIGAVGPIGPSGPTGLTGPSGPVGGQVWTSNLLLPSDLPAGDQFIGTASGVGPAENYLGPWAATVALPIPTGCTASGFSVSEIGAANTSTVSVALGVTDSLTTALADETLIALGCTITANNGGLTSCSSASTAPLAAGKYVFVAMYNFTSEEDFAGAHLSTSWICN